MHCNDNVIPNIYPDGRWVFEEKFKDGFHSLTIRPHIQRYAHRYPSGEVEEGSLRSLLPRFKGGEIPRGEELLVWLYHAVCWEHRENNYKACWRRTDFEVEDQSYDLEFNVRNGELRINFPTHTVRGKATAFDDLLLEFPVGIQVELLRDAIETLVGQKSENLEPHRHGEVTVRTRHDVLSMQVNGKEYHVQYLSASDELVIRCEPWTFVSHIASLPEDLARHGVTVGSNFSTMLHRSLERNGFWVDWEMPVRVPAAMH